MLKFIILAWVCAVTLWGQAAVPSIVFVTSNPAGACAGTDALRFNYTSGDLYGCDNGAWANIGGSGSTPGGSNTQLQFNNSGAFGGMSGTEWTDASRLLVFKDANENNVFLFAANPAGGGGCGFFYINCDGVSPASVGTATGTNGGVIEFDAPGGGSTTIATTGTGGNGGSVVLAGGIGGTATSAATTATGGIGGRINLSAARGGSVAVSGATNTGGVGGRITISSAGGGAATGGGGATNNAGNAGDVDIIAAAGASAASGATNNGGDAGDVRIFVSNGGSGSTSNGDAGFFAINAADGSTPGDDVFTVTRAGLATSIAYATGSNCSDSAGDAACGSASAGSIVVDAGDTTTVVSTTAITANSQIFLFVDASLGTRLSVTCNTTPVVPYISARTAATSFTITVTAGPVTNPACLNYLIIN